VVRAPSAPRVLTIYCAQTWIHGRQRHRGCSRPPRVWSHCSQYPQPADRIESHPRHRRANRRSPPMPDGCRYLSAINRDPFFQPPANGPHKRTHTGKTTESATVAGLLRPPHVGRDVFEMAAACLAAMWSPITGSQCDDSVLRYNEREGTARTVQSIESEPGHTSGTGRQRRVALQRT
jgi:hypothetical protein